MAGMEALRPSIHDDQERKKRGVGAVGRGVGTGQEAKGEAREEEGGARASCEMAAMGVFGRSSAVGSRPRESLRATS